MSERSWNCWPWMSPRPGKGGTARREHRLADPPPIFVPSSVCRYGSLRPVRRSRLGAPVCLLLLLGYALPVGVLLAIYSPESAPPPTAIEPMDVDPLILVPVNEMPADDRPEPALDLEGTAFEGEGGTTP